ncbi:acetate kinase [Streptococcus alactolyticus]|jgi:acetate kinase|uniref:Acetate kinase n=1 Tax=Streptococcus alactolyticus TaxID=29389 RepID=A0A6N7X371_STRAY|nr:MULTISPECIES: acetate kinase [Streptococcus]MDE2586674.1 acetate kinase [Lactobacillales bacterium]MCF2666248.1 acetate kinase [Streptococcus alactolyticus]MCF2677975.1 acetate kinase [Streptococcus alactolyticus]MCI6904874.1 acetate kinase [Streptococcus alactolyticus]MDD7362329.1 acetate kinase [Streptococcus alactolyticus]
MAKTISINAGSSSLKWQLYNMPEEEVIAKGLVERIGLSCGISTVKFKGKTHSETRDIPDHTAAVKILLDNLILMAIITGYDEIDGVGHRVVAGGEYFKESALVTDDVIQKVEGLSTLAPLHNPGAVLGIKAFKELLPDITSVVVFDTAFHTSMPKVAYRYPIANRYYKEYKVRKYGAHGTSHQYVAQEAAKVLGKPLEELKLITCHIGNGVSVTAVKGGQSVDTSMGLTPLGGTMMGTRSGSIDPGVIAFLMDSDPELNTSDDIRTVLNRQSGLLGVSEKSSDMRDILAGKEAGDANCELAYDMYIDRLRKYIAQYFAVLNGADAVIFTAGIGENSDVVREDIIAGMTWFGVDIDPAKNVPGAYGVISTDQARVKVMVIPTDEELVIARDVERFKNATNEVINY